MLALDFINIGNGDCILIREMEGTQQKFALMVDFGHDCLIRDDHPGELDPRSQRIYAGDFLRELGVTHLDAERPMPCIEGRCITPESRFRRD